MDGNEFGEKLCFRGFRPGASQTDLIGHGLLDDSEAACAERGPR